LKQQSFRRLGAMAATASVALVVLAACGAGDYSDITEHVTRVPITSDAAAQATKEAPPPGASPAATTAAEVAAGQATPPQTAATTQTVEIVAHDIYFEPKEVTIPANTDVTISLPNQGAAPHNFSIDALKISVDLPPGETKSVVVNAPPGTYEYYCDVPGHKEAGMVGTLTVK
jgi:uncharacterized cupredoxin-like copper-binding protein